MLGTCSWTALFDVFSIKFQVRLLLGLDRLRLLVAVSDMKSYIVMSKCTDMKS